MEKISRFDPEFQYEKNMYDHKPPIFGREAIEVIADEQGE